MEELPSKRRKLEHTASAEKSSGPTLDVGRNHPNPMMIELILENVFALCDFKTLTTCRLVCKHWYEVSLPRWLQCGPKITVLGTPYRYPIPNKTLIGPFLENVPKDDDDPMSYKCRGIRQYRNFVLENFYAYENNGCFVKLNNFWNSFGQWITHLDLKDFHIPTHDTFVQVMFSRFTPNLRELHAGISWQMWMARTHKTCCGASTHEPNYNLKTLKIIVEDGGSIRYNPFPMEWFDLLRHYPNLQHFQLTNLTNMLQYLMEDVLEGINRARDGDKTKLALKSLSFLNEEDRFDDGSFPSSSLRLFQKFKMPLEYLALIFEDDTPGNVIHDIVDAHNDTLAKLVFYKRTSLKPLKFPGLEHLQELTLYGRPFHNMKFLKGLPNLKRLTLRKEYTKPMQRVRRSIVGASGEEDMEGVKLLQLATFVCDYDRERWGSTDISRLHEWMPNVTKLEMKLTNKTFRAVCQHFLNLEELTVIGNKVDEEGITGIMQFGKDSLRFEENITNLKKLRTFILSNESSHYSEMPIRFTPKCLFFGFIKLLGLEKLEITTTKLHMTTQVADMIKAYLPFSIVTLKHGYRDFSYSFDSNEGLSEDSDLSDSVVGSGGEFNSDWNTSGSAYTLDSEEDFWGEEEESESDSSSDYSEVSERSGDFDLNDLMMV